MHGTERTRIHSGLFRLWEDEMIKNCINFLLSIKWLKFWGISHILIKSTLNERTPNGIKFSMKTIADGKGFNLIRLQIHGSESHYKINENISVLTTLIKHEFHRCSKHGQNQSEVCLCDVEKLFCVDHQKVCCTFHSKWKIHLLFNS